MPADQAQRASPDALLALAKKEGHGHLKIFLGAAPGVGKTYAMLTSAHSELAGGRDVVAGLVETHGRHETEVLTAGFEILPRKPIIYQNRILHEFDLDAVIARRPSLVLVDEYAHTNVVGSRHPKRWQDVEELLEAGIDVWTTLNIQHLESLNDLVQKITKVRVRETVPDRVFEEADEIVLVDFPPDELLKRLAEGKVYVQDTAARAVEGFFKPQNLTALRELALRRAAERIDTDLVERMQAQAIEGPWAAGERILACVGPDPNSPQVVRTAKRLADLIDAPWLAVVVERPGATLAEPLRKQTQEALDLAASLGAETRSLVGTDLAGELLRLARFENVTQIVIGRSRSGVWGRLRPTLSGDLIQRADDIAIHVVTGGREVTKRQSKAESPAPIEPVPFGWSMLFVALAVLIGRLITDITDFPNVSLLFLVAVLVSAIRFGFWPAVFSSALAFACYNFFFIEPLYTFTVARPYELFALLVFLVVAVMTSALAGRVRNQARTAVARMRATRRLYEFTRKLSGLVTEEAIAEGAASEINASLARPTVVLLAVKGELELAAAWPPEDALDTASLTAARWAESHDEPAGAETGTLPTVPWYFIPLRTPRSRVGVIGVATGAGISPLDAETRALLEALAEQTAAALERAALAKAMVSARADAETEHVRNTLLASISHDFRTPLASILGSVTTVIDYGDSVPEADRKELLGNIKQEAEALDEMVRNLLSITRIDAGALELRLDWIDLREIVDRIVSTARRRGMKQTVTVNLPPDLPLVRADASLIEQVLGNIVGNAVEHTPATTSIVIAAAAEEHTLSLNVSDNGPGIPADVLPRIFDKFVTAQVSATGQADRKSTGLGLAIAKGIMEAHHGTVSAESPIEAGHGTRITVTFPRGEGSR